MTAAEIQQRLSQGRERLLATISGVTEEQFKRRPPDGGWCIAEVLAHQLASEKLWAERVALAVQQDGIAIAPADIEALDAQVRAGRTAPVPQLIHGLLATRRGIETLLGRTDSLEGGIGRSVTHPERGPMTIEFILGEMVAAHEAEHVDQIEALKLVVGASPEAPGWSR